MAEFQEVMRQFARMHKAHEYIPSESAFASAVRRPDLFEKSVMEWAEEHPEPVYPTWTEYFRMIGLFPAWSGHEILDHTPIPADIAKQLGVEPKEG